MKAGQYDLTNQIEVTRNKLVKINSDDFIDDDVSNDDDDANVIDDEDEYLTLF
ncbi:hypothetical protein DPMN_048363, partial [Dreissena polymorpha]